MGTWKTPVIASSVMIAVFVGYLFFLPNNPEHNPLTEEMHAPRLEPLKEVRDVTPDQMLKAPKFETDYVERLPAIEPPPLPEKPPVPDRYQYPVVISAGVLKVGGTIIQLAGIKPVQLDAQCETNSGEYWPCGMFARTEMRQFIRGRPIECDRREVSTEPVRTRCRLASFDISAWLVLTGWAEPAGDLFADELSEAKAGERGIWRKAAP